jgi:sulfatase maturation enzyme AslB (radical SAM superfamily)
MEIVYPKNLYLNFSTKCNLNCKDCFGHHKYVDSNNSMSLKMAKKSTELFLNARDKSNSHFSIYIYGGEPLMNYITVSKYIKWLKKVHPYESYNISIYTNGILLDKEKIDFFLKHDICLAISYGSNYDDYFVFKRICHKHYSKIEENMKYALGKKSYLIVPFFIVEHNGCDKLENFLETICNQGYKRVSVARRFFDKWHKHDQIKVVNILNHYKKKYNIMIQVAPECGMNCNTCYPQNMMVFPNGDIYDVCFCFGLRLFYQGYISEEFLKTFYLGNVNTDKVLKMDVQNKKSIMHKQYDIEINTFCPTLTPNLKEIEYLWL